MKVLSVLMILGFTSGAAAAQQPARDSSVAKAVAAYTIKYTEPECKLAKGHFLVSSGATYLQQSIEKGGPNKERLENDGRRVLLQAIQQSGQDKNAAAWYYLARIELAQGDVAGADSAFRKAQELAPDCAAEITKYRRVAFAPIINRAIDFAKNNQNDSAMYYYRSAAAWYPASPLAAYNLAGMFAAKQMDDSALTYYGLAMKGASDTSETGLKVRNQSAYNRAVLLERSQRYPEAVAAFREYLKWVPDDADAKKGLIQSFRGAGMADSAAAAEQRLGVTAGTPGAAPAAGTGAVADYNAAVAAFNEKRFADAVTSVNKFLAADSLSREGLYIRARSLYELKKGPEAVKASEALLAVDPMSESAIQLLGASYNLTKNSTKAVDTRIRLNALPVSVSAVTAAPTAGGVGLTATVTGRDAKDAQAKPIAPVPVTLVFEFLNAQGAAVATQEVAVPALKAGDTFPVKIEVQGQGITDWRYHRK
jgi:tetratricopeptide (TPR) repeat protein